MLEVAGGILLVLLIIFLFVVGASVAGEMDKRGCCGCLFCIGFFIALFFIFS